MGIQIYAYPIKAMPADFTPELDEDNEPTNIDFDRAYTSVNNPAAMDGIEGGHEEDPLNPGLLGSRWYFTGPRLGNGVHAGNSLSRYVSILREQSWSDPNLNVDAPEARTQPFWDLIHFVGPHIEGGLMGQEAVKRLRESYLLYPTVNDPEWTDVQEFHEEWAAMVSLVANYPEPACLAFG